MDTKPLTWTYMVEMMVELLGRYSKMYSQAVKLREMLILGPDQVVPSTRKPKQQQTRLSPGGLKSFAIAYRSGIAIRDLALEFKIHRATVFELVERLGLPRRIPILTSEEVGEATRLYQSGKSLLKVGDHFGVAADTVALALMKAGVVIRKRRGAPGP